MRPFAGISFLILGLLAPVPGCSKSGPAEDKSLVRVGTGEVAAQFAPARRVFETSCSRCHTLGDVAKAPADAPVGRPKAAPEQKGPDLSKIGADPAHTRQWIIDYVRDPQSQNPKSKMPKFAGKLPDDALGALADYLVTLK